MYFIIRYTGNKIKSINLGSYNYLGFANNSGPIADNVINSIKTSGLAAGSAPQEFGKYWLTHVYKHNTLTNYVKK